MRRNDLKVGEHIKDTCELLGFREAVLGAVIAHMKIEGHFALHQPVQREKLGIVYINPLNVGMDLNTAESQVPGTGQLLFKIRVVLMHSGKTDGLKTFAHRLGGKCGNEAVDLFHLMGICCDREEKEAFNTVFGSERGQLCVCAFTLGDEVIEVAEIDYRTVRDSLRIGVSMYIKDPVHFSFPLLILEMVSFLCYTKQKKHKEFTVMENNDCLFCKIIKGDIPSQKVYENEFCYAFRDINPQAPVHILVVPKDHIESSWKIDFSNSYYVAKIFEAIPAIAKREGLENGYRVVTNCGDDACQTVKHLHFHILGGEKLSEKMS